MIALISCSYVVIAFFPISFLEQHSCRQQKSSKVSRCLAWSVKTIWSYKAFWKMERVTRLELATHSLGSYCSTTELYPHFWWKEQPSKSSCINYSIKRAFLQVLFHQNKKPASQRAFLLRATIPGPPAGSAHAFGQAKSPLIWPLPRTTFSSLYGGYCVTR